MAGRRKKGTGRRFIQFYHNVKRSAAYHGLGLPARCALIELMDRYNGINNGMISMSAREMAERLKCHHATAARALIELDDSGLARPLTGGVWRGRRATEWRLTFWRCDKTGELPVLNWPPACVAPRPAKVARGTNSQGLRRVGATRKPKSSINEPKECVSPATLIDIPGGTAPDRGTGCPTDAKVTAPPVEYPELPSFLDRRKPILAFSAEGKPWRKPRILSDEPLDARGAA